MSTGPASAPSVALPPAALGLIRLHTAWLVFVALVLVVFAGSAAIAGQALIGLIPAVLAIGAVVTWWRWSELRYRAYRWELTEDTVELQSGVVWRSHSVLPRTRIQNVSKTAGPVQQRAKLATVVVHSAGAHTPDIVIPHLAEADADALRSVLIAATPSANG